MASLNKTQIANKALTMVGAAPITSITQDSNNARIVNRVYDIALRSVLSECKWNFATKRRNLSLSADVLDWYDVGISTLYVKPADIVRIYGAHQPNIQWKEIGDYIVSDTGGLGLEYTFVQDDPSKYPSLFADAFIDKLASDVAYVIVNSATLGEQFLKKYQKLSLPNATAANSQTGMQQTLQDDAWELSKHFDKQADA